MFGKVLSRQRAEVWEERWEGTSPILILGGGLAASVALLYRCAKESGQALNCPTRPSIVFLGVKLCHTWARRGCCPLAGARCLRQAAYSGYPP